MVTVAHETCENGLGTQDDTLWIDRVRRFAAGSAARKVVGTKGANFALGLPGYYRGRDIISFDRAGTERVYLVRWCQGLDDLGVTETVHEGDTEDVRADGVRADDERVWLLGDLNSLLPGVCSAATFSTHRWACARSLTHGPGQPEGARSRAIHDLEGEGMPVVLAMAAVPVASHHCAVAVA